MLSCGGKFVGAFTLIELIVAIAVLGLMLILLLQTLSNVLRATGIQVRQMDSNAFARQALDTMEFDVHTSLIDNSASVLVADTPDSENLLALIARRRGPTTATNHRFLAVRYVVNTNSGLFRYYASQNFASTNFNLAASSATEGGTRPLVDGVLAARVRVLTERAAYDSAASPSDQWATNIYGNVAVPSGFKALLTRASPESGELANTARALDIWLACIDPKTSELLRSIGKSSEARRIFSSRNPSEWQVALDTTDAIPSQAKEGIRILNKQIALP